MKNLQLQKINFYVLGIILALLAACSSQPETTGSADSTADSGMKPSNDGSSDSNQEIPSSIRYEENFIGEWQAVESEKRKHLIITRNGDNFIIEEGDKTMPGIWDKENKVIRMNVGAPVDIMYIEKEDMIVAARGGKYRRVSEKL